MWSCPSSTRLLVLFLLSEFHGKWKHFSSLFGQTWSKKKQNYLFKVKFCTQTKSNMLNSMAAMVMLTFFLDQKYQNWPKLSVLRWNLIPRPIQIGWIQCSCSNFLFLTGNTLFRKFFFPKIHNCLFMIKIVT